MIDVAEAIRRLDEAFEPLASESVELGASLGRSLAESVVTDRPFPASDRSAMDGFAMRSVDLQNEETLRLVGEVRAGGDPSEVEIGQGECCRIFTGAVIPRGADTVVMVEKSAPVESELEGQERVRFLDRPEAGQHIRSQAQDRAAGETILHPGDRIDARVIAALASVGKATLSVIRRPRVCVLSTGDELVAVDQTPHAYQIRDSNGPMVSAQFAALGFEVQRLHAVEDRREALREAIQQGLSAELLVLTGGVSVGDYDFVADELERAGVETLFHGVAMKPGKPLYAGRHARGAVFGLPGNPLSAYVGTQLFALPVARRLAGTRQIWPRWRRATLTQPLRRRAGRETYHLVVCAETAGGCEVRPVVSQGSGDVLSLADANALMRSSKEVTELAAGAQVEITELAER